MILGERAAVAALLIMATTLTGAPNTQNKEWLFQQQQNIFTRIYTGRHILGECTRTYLIRPREHNEPSTQCRLLDFLFGDATKQ